MTDPELIRRAEAAGIAPCYLDWREQPTEVSAETLTAILAALNAVPEPMRERTGGGQRDAAHPAPGRDGAEVPARPRVPDGRSWGFTVQLYSVRSRRSWGHGDLRDLADLASWSARDLGAGFVLINPLHAAEPEPPVSASPYLPMTRRYVSPLYLRIEDIPEFGRLEPGQRERIDALAAPLRARNITGDLIDRDAVWAAKREALEIIHRVTPTGTRRAEYQRYRQREGRDLEDWATWCVLADRHGPDWRSWPAADRDPETARAAMPGGPWADPHADFHAWLQWLASEQLAAAQRAALAAGTADGGGMLAAEGAARVFQRNERHHDVEQVVQFGRAPLFRVLPGLLEDLLAEGAARVGAGTPLPRDAVGAAPFLVVVAHELKAHRQPPSRLVQPTDTNTLEYSYVSVSSLAFSRARANSARALRSRTICLESCRRAAFLVAPWPRACAGMGRAVPSAHRGPRRVRVAPQR